MKATIHSYTKFEAAQVLTAEQLNGRFNFLDEQIRLTRTKLIGVGILCGFEVSNPAPNTIRIAPGYGVTTDGYLICIADEDCYPDEPNPDCTHFAEFDFPLTQDAYPLFYNDAGDPYTFWELFPTPAVNDEFQPDPLTADFLEDKIVLLFLDCPETDLKNCDPDGCENGGIRIDFVVRKLLVSRQDMIAIIKEANSFDADWLEGDLINYINTRTRISPQYLKKFDVPATDLKTAGDIFEAYYSLFDPTEVNPVADAMDAFNTAFQPLLSDQPSPVDTNKIKSIFSDVQSSPSIGIQYYYDFLSDLIAAYLELQTAALEVLSECHLCNDRFPRHLMLNNALVSEQVSPSPYRHYFTPSVALDRAGLGLKKFKLLYRRLVLMIEGFDAPLFQVNTNGEPEDIRITPSRYGKFELSDKAIPYYYENSDSHPLFRFWNFKKTRLGAARHNLSYRADQYSTLPPVIRPLEYDTESYNFFRVEGHIGFPVELAEARINELIAGNRLPIKVISLGTGVEGKKNFSRYIKEHPGIEHKAGVVKGGTLLLVYHGVDETIIEPGDGGGGPSPEPGDGNVQIIHNASDPQLASVKVTLFERGKFEVIRENNFRFGQATPFKRVPSGNYTITISSDDKLSKLPQHTFELAIEEGNTYVLMLGGFLRNDDDPFGVDVFSEKGTIAPISIQSTNVLLYNGFSLVPKLKISVSNNAIVQSIDYRSYFGYNEIPAKNISIALTTDDGNSATYTAPLSSFRGKGIVVFISSGDQRLNKKFSHVRAALPDGTVIPFEVAFGPINESFGNFKSAADVDPNLRYATPTGAGAGTTAESRFFARRTGAGLFAEAKRDIFFGTLTGDQILKVPTGTVIADFFLPYICCAEDECDLPCNGEVETCDYEWFFDITPFLNQEIPDSALNTSYAIVITGLIVDGNNLIQEPQAPFVFSFLDLRNQRLQLFADEFNAVSGDLLTFSYDPEGSYGVNTFRIKRFACHDFELSLALSPVSSNFLQSMARIRTQKTVATIVIDQENTTLTDFNGNIINFSKTACQTENECEKESDCNLPCGGNVVTAQYRWIDTKDFIDQVIFEARNDYDITFYEMSINNRQLASPSNPIVITTTREEYQASGMSAVINNINAAFQEGPIFNLRSEDSNFISISYFECDGFRMTLSSGDLDLSANRSRYTYTHNTVLIDGEDVSTDSLAIEILGTVNLCQPSVNIGSQNPYTWLRRRQPPLVNADEVIVVAATKAEKDKWSAFVEKRRPQKFSDLPKNIKDKVREVKNTIKEMVPEAKVALVGSYAKGTWIDENTPEEFVKLKEKVLGKKGRSDFDFMVESETNFDIKEIKKKFDFPVEIFKGKLPKKKGIKLR